MKHYLKIGLSILAVIVALVFIKSHSMKKTNAPAPTMTILGASHVLHANWPVLLDRDDIDVVCIPDFSSEQLGWVLPNQVIPKKPKYCYLQTGTVDVLIGVPAERTVKNVQGLIEALTDNGIIPVLSAAIKLPSEYSVENDTINTINLRLAELARQYHLTFINMNKVLSDSAGIKPAFIRSGTVLNAHAHALWAAEILAFLNTDLSAPSEKINFNIMAKERIDRIIEASPENVKIVMLGNSITEGGGDWNRKLNRQGIRNSGQGGYTSAQLLWYTDTCVLSANPEICFIKVGVNDITLGIPVERIFENYKEIILRLQKNQITPVVQSTLLQFNGENNHLISRLNQLLEEYCNTSNIHFIDLNKKMSDTNGLLPELTSDGTHLTQKGYDVWSGILKDFFNTKLKR